MTVLSYALLQQRTLEQNIDIPVPRRGAREGLQDFPPGRDSGQRTMEQNVDIPVPRTRLRGGLEGFSPGQSFTLRVVDRTLIFQFLTHAIMVVFKVFLPDRVPHSVLWRRTMIFQFPVLVPVVVFPPDRVRSAQWSRSSIFQCLARAMEEVFLVFTLNRVRLLVVELLFPAGGLIMRIFRRVRMPSTMSLVRLATQVSLVGRWTGSTRSSRIDRIVQDSGWA